MRGAIPRRTWPVRDVHWIPSPLFTVPTAALARHRVPRRFRVDLPARPAAGDHWRRRAGHLRQLGLRLRRGPGLRPVDLRLFAHQPLLLLLWLLPRRWLARRWGSFLVGALCLLLLFVMLFVAVSEWTFWENSRRASTSSRSITWSTTEVIGNIRESYPVGWILSGAGAGRHRPAVARRWRLVQRQRALRRAFAGGAAWLALSVLGTWLTTGDARTKDQQHLRQRTRRQRHLPVLRRLSQRLAGLPALLPHHPADEALGAGARRRRRRMRNSSVPPASPAGSGNRRLSGGSTWCW